VTWALDNDGNAFWGHYFCDLTEAARTSWSGDMPTRAQRETIEIIRHAGEPR
jgi:hypothetical protein